MTSIPLMTQIIFEKIFFHKSVKVLIFEKFFDQRKDELRKQFKADERIQLIQWLDNLVP